MEPLIKIEVKQEPLEVQIKDEPTDDSWEADSVLEPKVEVIETIEYVTVSSF